MASVRAKKEQLQLSGKRVVSDTEWEKLQKEVPYSLVYNHTAVKTQIHGILFIGNFRYFCIFF